jgi:7,8-dihydropterin-6-yl-methyl-4-(beta-D-ribofuranosyl)aminobenzene 5'-phosphate synthase
VCTTTGTIQAVPVVASAEETGPMLTVPLEPVDHVSVTMLVDNVADLLAVDTGPARRPFIGDATRGSSPLFEDGWLYEGLVAEHGFSVLVTVERGGAQRRILFGAGLSPDALVTNMRRMGLDRVTSRSSCSATGTPTTPPAWTASSAP